MKSPTILLLHWVSLIRLRNLWRRHSPRSGSIGETALITTMHLRVPATSFTRWATLQRRRESLNWRPTVSFAEIVSWRLRSAERAGPGF